MGRREENKAAKRAAIVGAGWRHFILSGYDRCSVEAIIAEAGIARGTFYLYFPDKLSLFGVLLEQIYQPVVVILETSLVELRAEGPSSTAHRLRYIRTAIELAAYVERNRSQLMLHFREAWSSGPAGDEIRRWRAEIESLAACIIEEAAVQGALRGVLPQLAALSIVGSIERLVWAWSQDEISLTRREIAQQMADLFWNGLGSR
jgi:AcrR family transcriptional regulator